MNQILQVDGDKKSSAIDTKKIVLFFAVCIIVFGIIFSIVGVYTAHKNKSNEKVTPSTPEGSGSTQNPEYVPTITLAQNEDNKLIIKIESQIAISHIIYNWNSEASQTIEETGKTSIEEIIEIPMGENIFNLSVIDSDGKETKKQETYIIESPKPVIELSVIGNDIKISVTSETELSYITYRWNLETEKKEDMLTYENKMQFEKQIEIPKGQNTLKIVAVDINGIQVEKSQEIKGVTKAKTTTVIRDGYIHFTVIGEDKIKLVEFEFNGQSFVMNEETFGQTNVVNYKIKLIDGMNYLKIISTTENGAQDTSLWKYEYKTQ